MGRPGRNSGFLKFADPTGISPTTFLASPHNQLAGPWDTRQMRYYGEAAHVLFRALRSPTSVSSKCNRPPQFFAILLPRASLRRVAYSTKARRSLRPNARPNTFTKVTPTQFSKARAESIYLYKAFANRSYVFGCYFSGFLLISAGIFNHSTISWANDKGIEDKQPLPSFVPVFTFVGSLFFVGLGCYFICAKVKPSMLPDPIC